MSKEFTSTLEWPNGKGYTPCTDEYLKVKQERDSIYECGVDSFTMDDLSPPDYQLWNVLDHKLLGLQADGHVGKSVHLTE